MDLTWLLIPAAVGLFVLRTVLVARRLKSAASRPTLADRKALEDAKSSLQVHRDHLDTAVASPKAHLTAARALGSVRSPASRGRRSQVDRMVADCLPERRS